MTHTEEIDGIQIRKIVRSYTARIEIVANLEKIDISDDAILLDTHLIAESGKMIVTWLERQ